MKIPFYLLGLLLRYGPQHGYRIKQITEERIAAFAKIKLPTIYYHLDKLKNQGYVTQTMDKDGNRPEKMVYTITESGTRYFDELLEKQLKDSYSPDFAIDGVLYFKEKADQEKLLKELQNRREEIHAKLKLLEIRKESTLTHIHELGRFSAEAIFDHHICHLEAEYNWLEKTIKGLSE